MKTLREIIEEKIGSFDKIRSISAMDNFGRILSVDLHVKYKYYTIACTISDNEEYYTIWCHME